MKADTVAPWQATVDAMIDGHVAKYHPATRCWLHGTVYTRGKCYQCNGYTEWFRFRARERANGTVLAASARVNPRRASRYPLSQGVIDIDEQEVFKSERLKGKGERAMLATILGNAVAELIQAHTGRKMFVGHSAKGVRKKAQEWIASDSLHFCGFVSICDTFGFDPLATRAAIAELDAYAAEHPEDVRALQEMFYFSRSKPHSKKRGPLNKVKRRIKQAAQLAA